MIVTMSLTMSPTTAMSRILQCPELCRLVCEEIGSDDKCTLFRLSLSCRRFMEPALDVLWYKLDSFVPLVLCMAKDLRGEDVRPQEDKSLVSNGLSSTPHSIDVYTVNCSHFKGQCWGVIGKFLKQQQCVFAFSLIQISTSGITVT